MSFGEWERNKQTKRSSDLFIFYFIFLFDRTDLLAWHCGALICLSLSIWTTTSSIDFCFRLFVLFCFLACCVCTSQPRLQIFLGVTSEKSTRYRPTCAVCQFRRATITSVGLRCHADPSQNTQAEPRLLPCLHHRDRAFIIGMNKSFEWMSQDLMKNAFVFRQRSRPPLYFFPQSEKN